MRNDTEYRYERYHNLLPQDQRNPGQRDRDRILYTTAFRRLAEITQVVSAAEGFVFHNRLTHTLEVAQIARRLAEKLINDNDEETLQDAGGIDPDVVEAAALAHDLGHPPFGHIAEEELCSILDDRRKRLLSGPEDGFEGNAQAFRIVTKLAVRSEQQEGLDLTRATLNALLKYPRLRSPGERKWGVYESERDIFVWARKYHDSADNYKSAEAEIMDWADDIAYSVHDVDDFYRAGIIPLESLARKTSPEGRRFADHLEECCSKGKFDVYTRNRVLRAFRALPDLLPVVEPYRGTRRQRVTLRNATASQIGAYIGAMRLSKRGRMKRRVTIDPAIQLEVEILKELTRFYVVSNPSLSTQQYGQRKVIRTLFDNYISAADSGDITVFPPAYREQLEHAFTQTDQISARTRIVVDFISSMTESQALSMFNRFTGTSLGSVLDVLR